MKRNKFNLSNYVLQTQDMGQLIPFNVQEVLPGDTFQVSSQVLLRMQPLAYPVMHPIYVRIHHWFVPLRILWDDSEDFITGGRDGKSSPEYPTIDFSGDNKNVESSLADYFGLPPGEIGKVSAIPFRAYAMIYNEFYRDQDLIDPLPISFDSGLDALTSTSIQNVAWNKDYFTTSRPWQYKGAQVSVPVYSSVIGENYHTDISLESNSTSWPYNNDPCISSVEYVLTDEIKQNLISWASNPSRKVGDVSEEYAVVINSKNTSGNAQTPVNAKLKFTVTSSTIHNSSIANSYLSSSVSKVGGRPGEEYCYVSSTLVVVVHATRSGSESGSWLPDDMRTAMATQRFEEARAFYGSRYVEYLRYYGVKSSDARLQRPEYLGGGRGIMNISEVLQTAPGTDRNVASMFGHGLGTLRTNRFRRFFEEHGIIISLLSILPKTLYTDGIQRYWLKNNRFDFYTKEFAHTGRQELYQQEVFANAYNVQGPNVFGWVNRYDEYRSAFSRVAGEFRSTLRDWHLSREFTEAPLLNESFINANPSKRIFLDQVSHGFLAMIINSVRARRNITRDGEPR